MSHPSDSDLRDPDDADDEAGEPLASSPSLFSASSEAPSSGDPLDALLRRSMRALEGETPPGYFESLPRLIDDAIDVSSEAGGELETRGAVMAAGARDAREGRGKRRSSASQLGARGGVLSPPTSLPAFDDGAPDDGATEVVVRRRPTAPPLAVTGRAHRRSMLETQLGAPQPWWQSRIAAAALLAAVAAGAALIVTRRGDDGQPERRLGASSQELRNPARAPVRVATPPAPRLTEDQRRLRQALVGALPEARACVGARPLDDVELGVEVLPSGAVGAVTVRGAAAAEAAAGCISAAVQRAQLTAWASAPLTITLPLFE